MTAFDRILRQNKGRGLENLACVFMEKGLHNFLTPARTNFLEEPPSRPTWLGRYLSMCAI